MVVHLGKMVSIVKGAGVCLLGYSHMHSVKK
jgi:hypothetical protein